MELLFYLIPPATAFVVTFGLIPVCKQISPALGLIDTPDERRLHEKPIPVCGGIGLFIGVQAAWAIIFLTPWYQIASSLNIGWWERFFIPVTLVVILGIADDRFNVNAWIKLAGQTTAAIIAYYLGMSVTNMLGLTLPVGVDFVITLFWFVGAMNAFNLIDGMDGIAAGLAVIGALAISGQLLLLKQPGNALVTFSFCVACIAFLRYNFYPASVFLGDAGSMFIGFTIAALALSTGTKSTTVASIVMPFLVIGIPAFDMLLAIWRRSMRRLLGKTFNLSNEDKRVFGADLDHLHHRLKRLGLTHKQVALVLYGLAMSLVVVGVAGLVFQSHTVGIYLLALMAALYVIIRHLAYVELWHTTTVVLSGVRRPSRRIIAVLLHPVVDIAILIVSLTFALFLANQGPSLHILQNQLVEHAPCWVGVPFLVLVITGTYQRVWSRARVSEYALTLFAFFIGGLLAAILHDFFADSSTYRLAILTVTFWSLAGIPLVGVRALSRLLQDGSAYLRHRYAKFQDTPTVHALAYGAGYCCTLLLRAKSFDPVIADSYHYDIVGLIDDDTNLHGRFVHGCKVLGGANKLEEEIKKKHIEEVVVTTALEADTKEHVKNVTQRYGVRVRTWRCEFVEGIA